jgi:hypothetical protein
MREYNNDFEKMLVTMTGIVFGVLLALIIGTVSVIIK